MPNTRTDQIYATALELEKSIRSMAFEPNYDSQCYRAKIDALRECITDLALSGEIGKLKTISVYSLDLLEPHGYSGAKRYHRLKPADLSHHLQAIPAYQDALVNDVSTDKTMNRVIVDSIIKANFLDSESMLSDCQKIANELARANDKDAWLTLVQAPENRSSQFLLVVRSIGLFDQMYLEEHKKAFAALGKILKKNPVSFGWGSGASMVRSEDLFDALNITGFSSAILPILKLGWLEFREPHMLQRNMQRYGITPDDEYRKILADAIHVPDGQYRHLATSYYQYELSNKAPLVAMRRPMSPAILAEVIDQDGRETPYGKIQYAPKQIGHVLDLTFKAALHDHPWEQVKKMYSNIPENILMKSNIYKGNKLSDELGL